MFLQCLFRSIFLVCLCRWWPFINRYPTIDIDSNINYTMSNKCQQIIMWSRTIPESFDVFLPMLGGPSAWSNSQLPLLEPRRQMSNHPWGYRNDPFGHHTNHSMIIFTRLRVYTYVCIYIYIYVVCVCVCDMCLFIFMFIHVHVGAHCSYIVHYESNLFLAFSMPICPFPHPKSISVILEWLVSPLPISTDEWYNFNTRNVRPQGFKELIHCGGQSGCLQIGFKKGFDWNL